ncbi:MAG: hypothetical protein HYZ29_26320 [Myxococcales bacterium]|nr:hypothetical protein [Myxococcales bacterium]
MDIVGVCAWLGCAAVVGSVEVLRRKPWTSRRFDRGGLRVHNWVTGRRSYVPFTRIASVDVELGNTLALKDVQGKVLARVCYFTPDDCFAAFANLPRLAGRPLSTCSAFARGGLDFDGWLRRIRSLATQRGPYRGTDIEPPQALAVARYELAPLTERAAAIYYLCCAGQAPRDLLPRLDRESPPLLVVVAALAPGGEALLPLAKDLVRYLPQEDQAAFQRAAQASATRSPTACPGAQPKTA